MGSCESKKTALPIPQRNFPVAVVDDFAHQALGAFFGGGEDLGDEPEAIMPSFDSELLEDVAGTVDIEVATAMEGGEFEVHIGIIAHPVKKQYFIRLFDLQLLFSYICGRYGN